jgi:hypothetical protein
MALTKLIENGYLKKINDDAIIEISKDREQFNILFDIIHEYCKQHKIYLSDKYIILDMQNELQAIYEKQIMLYTKNPFLHANNIANIIHEKTRNKYVKLRTIKEQEEFIIDYNARSIITVYNLEKYTTSTHTLISPTVINGINYFPAEIEIIDIYHQLYINADYTNNAMIEDKLYNQVMQRREKNLIGGMQQVNCKELRKELVEHVKISLVKDFLLHKDQTNKHMLLGTWAYNWYKFGKEICANKEKVQIMSILTPNEVLKAIQNYINEIVDADIYMKEQDLHIPKDFRTKRFTLYMTSKTKHGIVDKPFLDLFNCANFEIIPYDKINGILIAYKWVLLRFMFIDIWIIRFIKNIGLLNQQTLDMKLESMWSIVEYFKTLEDSADVDRYLGIYINYDIAKKMDALQNAKFFQPYFPEEYMLKHKKYRSL